MASLPCSTALLASRRPRRLGLGLGLALGLCAAAGHVHANGGPDTPATAVPQFADEAPGISLWPLSRGTGEIRLRPAGLADGTTREQLTPLPARRDSTDYLTQTSPGAQSGHELYQDVAVANQRDESASAPQWLVAVYNSGIQVWDLSEPELPSDAVSIADGFGGAQGTIAWHEYAGSGEDDFFTFAADVVDTGSTIDVGVASVTGVGFTAWRIDPTSGQLTQRYQDLASSCRDVSVIEGADGNVYAFAANRGSASGNGVRVYDLSAAPAATVCRDDGPPACDVFRGLVGDLPAVDYASAHVVDGRVFVAASAGASINSPIALQIWEVDPADPSNTSQLRLDAPGANIHSPELFRYAGQDYLAFVDKSAGPNRPGQMRIHAVGDCLDDDGCDDLGPALATENLLYSAASQHFLDLSFSNGVPYLHYGMETTGLFGSGFERLWDLSQLPQMHAADTLPELTDGGGTYADPCSGEPVDYFGDYYVANEYGLEHFNPRHAVFAGPYLYRAARSVLDVHERSLQTCGDGVVQPDEACDDPDDPMCVDCSVVTSGSGGLDDSGDGGAQTSGDSGGSGGSTGPGAGDGSDTTSASAGADGGGGDSGGCGCHQAPRPADLAWSWLGLFGLAALGRRRR